MHSTPSFHKNSTASSRVICLKRIVTNISVMKIGLVLLVCSIHINFCFVSFFLFVGSLESTYYKAE